MLLSEERIDVLGVNLQPFYTDQIMQLVCLTKTITSCLHIVL
jgi:hypothetical protein